VEEIKERYAAVGGKSPLLEITMAQAQALEDGLNQNPDNTTYRVFVGMRHWFPYIHSTIENIIDSGFERIVALCMTPYYSKMSTQAYFEKMDSALESITQEKKDTPPQITRIFDWHSHPIFIQALSEKLEQAIRRFPEVKDQDGKIIFTAHSLPAALIEQGDPYALQIQETARAVAEKVGLNAAQWVQCFQSAGARNTRWLGPSLEETMERLADQHISNILVDPIGFVCDHLEILYDIDIEAKEIATRLKLRLERTESLNISPRFIDALAQIIRFGG
jgi:ferrochelatase